MGRPIATGPEITTIREGLAAVAAGECVMILAARARNYFTHPGIAFVELDLPLPPLARDDVHRDENDQAHHSKRDSNGDSSAPGLLLVIRVVIAGLAYRRRSRSTGYGL